MNKLPSTEKKVKDVRVGAHFATPTLPPTRPPFNSFINAPKSSFILQHFFFPNFGKSPLFNAFSISLSQISVY